MAHGGNSAARSCSSCAKPSTAFIGVRSSWLARDSSSPLGATGALGRLLVERRLHAALAIGDVEVDAHQAPPMRGVDAMHPPDWMCRTWPSGQSDSKVMVDVVEAAVDHRPGDVARA